MRIQSMQQPHADHCVCVVGEYLYAIGGRDYHQELNAVERYDPRLNSWEYMEPLKKEVCTNLYCQRYVAVDMFIIPVLVLYSVESRP